MCQKRPLNNFNVQRKDSLKSNQTIYNVKWTFTQKHIPKENEKCNVLLANELSVQHV